MGHMTVSNVSRLFNKMVKRTEGATINEVVDELERRGSSVMAAEGPHKERYIFAMAAEEIITHLYDEDAIEPVKLSRKQQSILNAWLRGDIGNWDSGDDGKSGQYGVLDSIRWRALKKRLPILEEVVH